MISVNVDLMCKREDVGRHAERHNLTILKITEDASESLDCQLQGSREDIKNFYLENANTGESFEKWLQYSEIVRSQGEFRDLLMRIQAFAHDKYKEKHEAFNMVEEARWDDISNHLKLAHAALTRKLGDK